MAGHWINDLSNTPKYKQLSSAIIEEIELGNILAGDALPSVNQLIIKYNISRDTVVKAYDLLKDQGVIEAVRGKGYYVCNTSFRPKAKVFLLFNKLSAHKKIIYDAFTATLGQEVQIDFFIYNNDLNYFKKLLDTHGQEHYSHLVIIPHFQEGSEYAHEILAQLPKEKLIFLDKKPDVYFADCASVYQDFENDLYQALIQVLSHLSKYQRLKIIFPHYSYHPQEILSGFNRFCDEFAFEHQMVNDPAAVDIQEGDVFITLMEDDLVSLIKSIKRTTMKVGKDVGIISYNETPLKEVLLDGITVISTDFKALGERAAQFILTNEKCQIANPFHLILRNSL